MTATELHDHYSVTRDDLVAQAETYLGRPYRRAGRNARGMDCIGIPLCLARDLKVRDWIAIWSDEECQRYVSVREPGFMRAKLDRFVELGYLRKVSIPELEVGDLILRWGGFGHDCHVSLIYHGDWIIEAHAKEGVRKTRIFQARRRFDFLQGYQFAGVS